MPAFVGLALMLLNPAGLVAVELPQGYMSEKESRQILAKTLTLRLDPDLSPLSEAERKAVPVLLEVGQIFQELYEITRHYQARSAHAELLRLDEELGHPQATRDLIDLYRLFKGPVARTLDNKLVPFLPVEERVPGKNVYPWDVEKDEIEQFLENYPEEESQILHVRTVVRRSDPLRINGDLSTLENHPILDLLHPGLKERLVALREEPSRRAFYAVPYSVAFSEYLMGAYYLLNKAAALLESDDQDFSRFLRHRAVDLLRDDYEAGDAAWVTGSFGNLNAEIGSYETYDDQLYGVKSFFALSLVVKDPMMSSTVETVKTWLQEMEDILPYEPHKTVRGDIPIGAYNVVADFGQARGTNTATILPNESYITRKYGRTILLRNNILTNKNIFEVRRTAFNAAVSEQYHNDYDPKGDFFRTLWHEIGHYLGPDLTEDGRTLDVALEEDVSILEELKADLIALYVSKRLRKKGYYDKPRLRAVQASGIRRVLQKNQPKKSQVYRTMQLMQMNYYLEKGLLEYDGQKNKLVIHHDQYHPVVESMLREVLALQQSGDKGAADEFIAKYSTWEESPHERVATSMKEAENYRYGLVRYGALGE
ncbi:MAG: NUDIX hydrolase [Candidatus Latescibacterota bacterium]|nr:MAG: NUDIX hydrolase [Candidatus Latescibacterota bacterium]